MSPAEDLDLYPDHVPQPVLRISTPQQLRAVSDPTRLRIIETMVQRQDPAWSVKELAEALGVPQTRLYHHVDQLLAHDLIRAVERRIVSGLIETRYRVTALSLQLDRRMFESGEPREILHHTLVAVFDTARDEVEAAIGAGVVGAHDDRLLLSRGLARLTPDRAAELRRRLLELEGEFGADAPAEGSRPWGVVLALYPVVAPADPAPPEATGEEPSDA